MSETATSGRRACAPSGSAGLAFALAIACNAVALGASAQAPAPTSAPAQPAPAQPASPGDRDYDATIESALNEYRLGNWDEATALFVRAHALRPSARTLRGMGLSEFENRKYVLALVHCSAALSDARNPLNTEQRGELES